MCPQGRGGFESLLRYQISADAQYLLRTPRQFPYPVKVARTAAAFAASGWSSGQKRIQDAASGTLGKPPLT